jgi:hypothetical protein
MRSTTSTTSADQIGSDTCSAKGITVDAITEFVVSDADVQTAMDNEAMREIATKHLIRKILKGRDIDRIRKALGADVRDFSDHGKFAAWVRAHSTDELDRVVAKLNELWALENDRGEQRTST